MLLSNKHYMYLIIMNLNLVIQSILSSTAKLGTEQTVHSPLFFRKIIEIESFALRATHLA